MTETSGGKGTAHAPAVVAANDVGALQAALAVALERNAVEEAETAGARNIASLEAGVAKLEAHLAHHKELLAAAKSAEEERLAAKAAEPAESADESVEEGTV
jgi:hypothetical protein